MEAKEEEFAGELTSRLSEITASDEETGAHAEHLRFHYRYIQLVDNIQDLVAEFDADEDEDEAEVEEEDE